MQKTFKTLHPKNKLLVTLADNKVSYNMALTTVKTALKCDKTCCDIITLNFKQLSRNEGTNYFAAAQKKFFFFF